MSMIQVKSAIANGEAMSGIRNHHSAKREQKRERQFKVENKKANLVLIIATAIGALILSIAAIA